MAVDLRFYDINGNEISLDKVTGGHDFGVTKKNTSYTYPVIIKNVGTTNAINLSIRASALNAPNEISSAEYDKQLLAATWQRFSLIPSQGFKTIIALPNINAGKTLKGYKEYVENFTNPVTSAWKNDTLGGHIFQWTGSSLACTDGSEGDGKIYARADATGWGTAKEIDFICKFNTPVNATMGSAFMMFCLRRNCLGDEKGYLINMKRQSSTGSGGTAMLDIRKGAGIKDSGINDFGTTLITSSNFNFTEYSPVRIKLFTNSSGLPEIKVWINNILDTDTPITWGTGTTATTSWIDTSNTYPFEGGISIILGSGMGGTFDIRNASLLTDDVDGKVYIQTIVGDGAVDSATYKSALELSYDIG
jgi:hypothetical protein